MTLRSEIRQVLVNQEAMQKEVASLRAAVERIAAELEPFSASMTIHIGPVTEQK